MKAQKHVQGTASDLSLLDLNWDKEGGSGSLSWRGRSEAGHIGVNGPVVAFGLYSGIGEDTARFSAEARHDQLRDIVS